MNDDDDAHTHENERKTIQSMNRKLHCSTVALFRLTGEDRNGKVVCIN